MVSNKYFKYQKKTVKKTNADKGTKWILYLNSFSCIIVSFYLVSEKITFTIGKILFPDILSIIGVTFIYLGIVLRLSAVLTLKRAFTLNVQTEESQQLITIGLYKYIRHPAYTGSILSLCGISLALRGVLSVLFVIISCLICYKIRIYIEEKTLQGYFGEEYKQYKKYTGSLFPCIIDFIGRW